MFSAQTEKEKQKETKHNSVHLNKDQLQKKKPQLFSKTQNCRALS